MSFERMNSRLAAWLRESADLPVSTALDHRVRTALRTMPLAVRTMPLGTRTLPLATHAFTLPVMALGLAVASTLAMTVSLALSLASAGAGESGVLIATAVVVGYLGVSSVVVLPLLLKFKAARPSPGAAA